MLLRTKEPNDGLTASIIAECLGKELVRATVVVDREQLEG